MAQSHRTWPNSARRRYSAVTARSVGTPYTAGRPVLRAVTVDRLTALTTAGLLPGELQEMAVYYLAKAQRELGRSADSRRGMQ
ncbi:hypothetical protein ACIBG6_38560 [Streptomyces sp. NPDC050842]|uniref:hypothetical protein n=1 Tax=Streptomyces sp. NPDC050842 TaxID=3365636 RepID=UPI00378F5E26